MIENVIALGEIPTNLPRIMLDTLVFLDFHFFPCGCLGCGSGQYGLEINGVSAMEVVDILVLAEPDEIGAVADS